MKVSFTLGELSTRLDVPLRAPSADLLIEGLATLESAREGQLAFLSNPRYIKQLAGCRASAVIIHPDLADSTQLPCLLSPSPYVTYARVSQLFAEAQEAQRNLLSAHPHVHETAVISLDASIGKHVSIGAHVVIESGAVVGDGCRIGAGCYVGSGVHLGNDSQLYPHVTLYHDVKIGERAILHSGAVIGADGFGFAFDKTTMRSIKIAQLGSVQIGDDVEIGASSTIDRGALDDTVIGNGVKIDNQVQIGHNCVVGDHSVICGCSALAGSSRLGRYCVIGGGVGITGHLSIVDGVTVSAMSMVTQSIERPGLYSSGTLLQESTQWKRNVVSLGKLSELTRTVRNIERQLQDSNGPESGKNYDERGRD